MSRFLTTQKEYREAVARETARMSYPGSMSRGKKPVLREGTKKGIEKGFFTPFLGDLWDSVGRVANQFDDWHEKQAQKLGHYLRENSCLGNLENNGDVVGAKLINTFMYQLMKYEQFRPLWSKLHLPLDRKMLKALLEYKSLADVRPILNEYKDCPYQLPYAKYGQIQKALLKLVDEYKLTSRIELNPLWADKHSS